MERSCLHENITCQLQISFGEIAFKKSGLVGLALKKKHKSVNTPCERNVITALFEEVGFQGNCCSLKKEWYLARFSSYWHTALMSRVAGSNTCSRIFLRQVCISSFTWKSHILVRNADPLRLHVFQTAWRTWPC